MHQQEFATLYPDFAPKALSLFCDAEGKEVRHEVPVSEFEGKLRDRHGSRITWVTRVAAEKLFAAGRMVFRVTPHHTVQRVTAMGEGSVIGPENGGYVGLNDRQFVLA